MAALSASVASSFTGAALQGAAASQRPAMQQTSIVSCSVRIPEKENSKTVSRRAVVAAITSVPLLWSAGRAAAYVEEEEQITASEQMRRDMLKMIDEQAAGQGTSAAEKDAEPEPETTPEPEAAAATSTEISEESEAPEPPAPVEAASSPLPEPPAPAADALPSPQEAIEAVKDSADSAKEAAIDVFQSAKEALPEQIVESAKDVSPQQVVESAKNVSPQQVVESAKSVSPQQLVESAKSSTPEVLKEAVQTGARVAKEKTGEASSGVPLVAGLVTLASAAAVGFWRSQQSSQPAVEEPPAKVEKPADGDKEDKFVASGSDESSESK